MNITPPSTQHALPSAQSGAVLIVVLLFLIMITVVGVIAVRNSSTNLKLATSDQINTVLLQASDSANNKLEQSVNGDPASTEYKKIMSLTGVFGYYILGDKADDIIDFCYRPRSDFYNIANATIRRGTGVLVSNPDEKGYCDPTKANDYTSSRSTTMTQIMIKNTNKAGGARAFGHMNLGSDSEAKTAQKQQFDIYATSTLPSYGSAAADKVKECFKKDASSATDGVVKCMTDNNIPSKMLVQQVDLVNIEDAEYCKKFGKTSGSSTCPN